MEKGKLYFTSAKNAYYIRIPTEITKEAKKDGINVLQEIAIAYDKATHRFIIYTDLKQAYSDYINGAVRFPSSSFSPRDDRLTPAQPKEFRIFRST